eukprot:2806259-Rhodomonas_salina.1
MLLPGVIGRGTAGPSMALAGFWVHFLPIMWSSYALSGTDLRDILLPGQVDGASVSGRGRGGRGQLPGSMGRNGTRHGRLIPAVAVTWAPAARDLGHAPPPDGGPRSTVGARYYCPTPCPVLTQRTDAASTGSYGRLQY